jgi:acyl-CoA thioester hydrolase
VQGVRFAVDVAVRWSDMDSYGHVNHARTVTLLEQARIELFFNEMPRRGMGNFDSGIVVSKLSVEYLSPLVYDGEPVRVEAWVTEVKAASFVLRYAVHNGTDPRVLVRAETTMVPYNLARTRPRRLTATERDFLALWTTEDAKDAASA